TPPGGAALVAGSESADPALAFALAQNQPNPFRTRDVTVVRFTLPEARDVRLDVFDVSGRIVQTLASGPLGPGLHTLTWNGTGRTGARLPSGVYLYRLGAGRRPAPPQPLPPAS